MTEENIIYIGNKPLMNYVLAVVTQFNDGASTVKIKARGRSISKAVDVAEVVRNKFLKDLEIEDIHISTEEVTNYNDIKTNVSIIGISLAKQ